MDAQTGASFKEECVFHEVSVDWRGRPCKACKHGGMRAAVFVLGIQAFEIMAIAAVGNNLITYAFNEMHFSLPKSANVVTNFVGTTFLLSLLGGYLSDSYLGSFWTILIFGFVELSGYILLSLQAHISQLRTPHCNMLAAQGEMCIEAKGFKAFIFFVALYLVALGSGCLKPNMISHGADQFSKEDDKQAKKLSTYFNSAYFSFCVGELIALTILVWVQTRSGMDVGLGVSAAAMASGLISLICGTMLYRNRRPQGSIFIPIAQVLVAAFVKRKQVSPSGPDNMLLEGYDPMGAGYVARSNLSSTSTLPQLGHTKRFTFLDKACIMSSQEGKESPWRLCSVAQVEQVKVIISVIPIFACTIIFNTVLAQLQTFSVQQGSAMNTHLTNSFQIPPASLQAIPYMMLIFFVPLYETILVPFMRRFTSIESGISHLHRIGVGLFVVTFSMVSAALVESKRRRAAIESGEIISIFWVAPQFLIFGLSEMFTAVGLVEFFYKQSLAGMQSFLTALTYVSYSCGFFLSSLLVSLVDHATSNTTSGGWLKDKNLNKNRLDLFYWLLAGLSLLNFFNYLFWSRWYSCNISLLMPTQEREGDQQLVIFCSSKHAGDEQNIL